MKGVCRASSMSILNILLCFVPGCTRCTAGYAEPHHKPTAGAGSRYANRAVLRQRKWNVGFLW